MWTHVPGVVAAITLLPILIVQAVPHGAAMVVSICLFGAAMLLMYGCSSLYHLMTPGSKAKRVFRVFDHVSIYAMIAGCYSPILLGVLGHWYGLTLFIVMWSFVLLGMIGKIFWLGKHPKLSLALYLVMGWVALIVIYPMWKYLPHLAFWFIVGEGVCYSIGSYFFAKDEQHAFYHAIWHVWILLGTLAHVLAMFFIL